MIFVNSMSDLFHTDVSDEFICQAIETMRQASWHTFQILTKRSSRLWELDQILDWPPNVWLGVTVERADYVSRIDDLRSSKANVKFVSFEPLLGRLDRLNLASIDWAIVGGESGPGARPISEDWVVDIRDQCLDSDVAFFFKQWGGVRKKKAGRALQGRTWEQRPPILAVI
jgi:protein gp37